MSERSTTVRYRIVLWLTLAAALSYLCRNAVGVAESSMRADLGLTFEQSGWFMGAFFWTYAFFQIPSGWFSQHYGTRFSLCLFAIIWSLATLGMGLAPGLWLLVIAQLIMGIAQAGIFPASCNSVGHWMPISQRSLACGFLAAGMQIGAILAAALTGILLAPLGWRWVFIAFSIPGILWAIVFYIRFRDRPEQVPWLNNAELGIIQATGTTAQAERKFQGNQLHSWGAMLRSIDLWFLCGQQICRSAGYMFFASWFPTFLQSTRGISVETSGYLQGLVLAGTLTGSLAGGTTTDWIWRRTGNLRLSRCGVGAMALGTCGILVLAAWFVEDAKLAVTLLALGSFSAAFAGPCTFATTIEIGGARVPEVFGLVNMSGNLATAACPILIGKLFDWTANWDLALILFAGIYILGAVCWALVNPHRGATMELRKSTAPLPVSEAPSPA